MAIGGLNFGGLGKKLLHLHQQARDVSKLGLREHETLVASARGARNWDPIITHDEIGNFYTDFTPTDPQDIVLQDSEKLERFVKELGTDGKLREFAKRRSSLVQGGPETGIPS